MSLTVSCDDCVHPTNSRQIVQWRQNCSDCADLCVANHLAEFPAHRVRISGFVSDAPFSTPKQISRLFGDRRSA